VKEFAAQRARMVEYQLRRRGIMDEAVLAAFDEVPRERFVASAVQGAAYDDHPLPIGEGQTISQPYVVAIMAEALEIGASDHILEVGAGSGYAAAVLSRIGADVLAVERFASLVATARAVLAELGYDNVVVVTGDGSLGWPEAAPYDAICVSAAAPGIPPALVAQLAPSGRLVIPSGHADDQRLVRVRRTSNDSLTQEDLGAVRFVPLVGEQGWHRSGRHSAP
jgi:protein-L-isoaspartate(D-aspartate) O-methyltransferase